MGLLEERVGCEDSYKEVAFPRRGRFLGNNRQRARRVVVTMVTFLAWVIFIILFTLLWAPSLSLFQNIVILFASFVAAATVGAGAYALGGGTWN